MLLLALLGTLAAASSGIQSGRASDFYVDSLPGVVHAELLPEMHAGRLEVGSKMGASDASMFFWHFRASQPTNKTIVWFNGGPGCSSMDGALLEVGPLRFVNNNLTASPRDSWTELANMLFVDQPFGTGFSDPQDPAWISSLEQAGDAVTMFLLEYAKVFPELLASEIVLAGESFAGQYIPHIYRSLQQSHEAHEKIKVAGLALINPWIDPANQYLSYVPFIKENHLVSEDNFEGLDRLHDFCLHTLERGDYGFSVSQCEQITDFMNGRYKDPKKCFNAYDISLESPAPSCGMEWPYELPNVGDWLNRQDVRDALHVEQQGPKDSWRECSSSVQHVIKNGQISREFLPSVLQSAPLLLMIGDNDYVCNRIGLERMVKSMEWKGGIGLSDTVLPSQLDWGSFISDRGLSVAHVSNASHMVPYDHLKESIDVLKHWLYNDEPVTANPEPISGNHTDPAAGDTDSAPSRGDINKAVSQAYKRAALVFVGVFLGLVVVFGVVCYFRGGVIQKTSKERGDYVPLHDVQADEFEV